MPPHVCRIFTAEDYAHRASVEDVVSRDKLQSVVERTPGAIVRPAAPARFRGESSCLRWNRDSWQFPRSGYNGDANGFTSNSPTSFSGSCQRRLNQCPRLIIPSNQFNRSDRSPSTRMNRRPKCRLNRHWCRRYHGPIEQPLRPPLSYR